MILRALLLLLLVTLPTLAQACGTIFTCPTPTYDWVIVGTPTGSAPSTGDVDISGAFKTNGAAASTTINGTPCAIGGTCTVTASAAGIVVGTTTIGSGTTGAFLYDNAGVLGKVSPGTNIATAFGNALNGTGNFVGSTSPSIATPTITGSFTATGLVTNADLANPATTVNGQSCALGSTCTVTAAATGITVGTTTIGGGTNGTFLFDNSGVLGGIASTGSGNVVLATSPSIASPTITSSFTATGLVTNADLANAATTVNGQTCTLGSTCTATVAISSGVTGLGTGVATALGDAVNTSGGVVTSAGTITASIPVEWDSNTTVANGTIPVLLPAWAGGGTITSVSYYTNGTGTPSFTADVEIGDTGVTSCSALSVSSATPATTSCTGGNTFTSSSSLTVVISSASGTPQQALVQINMTHTLN